MVSLETVEREIDEIEAHGKTTYSICERLAWLYIVRDHLRPQARDAETQRLAGSEFVEACGGVSYPALMSVLDEHMEALKVVQPREYESLMGRIRSLRQPL